MDWTRRAAVLVLLVLMVSCRSETVRNADPLDSDISSTAEITISVAPNTPVHVGVGAAGPQKYAEGITTGVRTSTGSLNGQYRDCLLEQGFDPPKGASPARRP